MPKETNTPEALEKLIALMGQSQLLREMDADKIIEFASRAQILTYFNGETIVEQDDFADCFYFIIQGQVRVSRIEGVLPPPPPEDEEFPEEEAPDESFEDEAFADAFEYPDFDGFDDTEPLNPETSPEQPEIESTDETEEDKEEEESPPPPEVRVLNYMSEGEFLGELALRRQLQNEDEEPGRRYATAEVIIDTIVAKFSVADFKYLEKIYPAIEKEFEEIERGYTEHQKVTFNGIQPDEVGIVNIDRHGLWFFARLTPVFALLLVGLLLSVVIGDVPLGRSIPVGRILLWLFTLASIGWGLFEFLEWKNDDFIISSWRVIHIERYVLGGGFTREVPLVNVLGVDINTANVFTRIMGFDNVNIRPAGAGVVVFDGVANGEKIKDIILREQKKAKARSQASDIAAIHDAVQKRIISRKVEVTPVKTPPKPEKKPFIVLDVLKVFEFFIPRVQETKADGTIIWRQHLLIWLGEVWQPIVVLALATYVILAGIAGFFPFVNRVSEAVVAGAVVWAIAFGWYAFKHDNWHRISYEVTKSKLIKRSKPVLQLRGADVNETTFDNVQNINSVTPNFITKLLRLGHVEIKTASVGDPFIFKDVYYPERVQQEISSYRQKFIEGKEQQQRSAEEERFTKWLTEYHQLKDQPPEEET